MAKKGSVIDLLRNDEEYYRGVGRNYLSNSDIGVLLNNPKLFGQPTEDGKSLAEGRYFHQMLLEPMKAVDTLFCDCANRNTNIYKDYLKANNVSFVLLKNEMDAIGWLVHEIKSNVVFFDEIYKSGNLFEEPAVGTIKDFMWKGKADIVTDNAVIDLKTTSDIMRFKWSAKEYNYDSQAYIYQELFGKPLVFYAIDKSTGMLGVFRPTEAFIKRGEAKLEKALEVYNRFFGPNKVEDVTNYFIDEILD